jgi:ubiquinone/menaquinone biosynthesis C-methylase UbiE
MTKNRNLKRRIRLRAAKTGESYSSARQFLVPADHSASRFETQRPTDYLLRAATSTIGKAYKSLAIELLAVGADSDVLDLGCGTGGELGPLLRAIGPAGSVTAVDTDLHALEVARDHYRDPRLRLHVGDAHGLDLADASVDRVYLDRTMQHVEAPARVLEEARRLLQPGGRIVLAEPDWRSLLVDHPEPELPDAYRRFVVDQVIRNPRIGSELPRLVQDAGFALESVTPVTATYTNVLDADHVFGFARVTRRAVEAGYLDDDQADRWLDYLSGDVFFASLTIFVTTARRR